jgi:hypothetical protein
VPGRARTRRSNLKSAMGCLRCSFTGLQAASWTRYLKRCLRRTRKLCHPRDLPLSPCRCRLLVLVAPRTSRRRHVSDAKPLLYQGLFQMDLREPPFGAEGCSISITALAIQICVVCAPGRDGGAGRRPRQGRGTTRRASRPGVGARDPADPVAAPGPGSGPGCLEQGGERFAAGSRGMGYRSMVRGAAV